MPEGPEVKQIVDLLNNKFKNKKIDNIEVLGGRYLRKKFDKIPHNITIYFNDPRNFGTLTISNLINLNKKSGPSKYKPNEW